MTTNDDVIKGYVEIEARVDKMRDKYAVQEGYVDGEGSPWVPFVPNVYIKHLTFDILSSSAANVLWVQPGGELGRHRHRAPVSGYVIAGTWNYLEHSWVANAGDFVRDRHGHTHAVHSEKR